MTYPRTFENPRDRWVGKPSIVILTGSQPTITDQPDRDVKRSPVGFTRKPAHTEPQLWDGDNA